MNPEERKSEILRILEQKDAVKIAELSKVLKVSRETVRKYLYELEEEKLIKKIHGGAILDTSNQETDYDRRMTNQEESKLLIAKQALSYIEEGDTIYLDYGTTIYQLAKHLKKISNITVVTNSIPIVNLLLRYENVNVIILGGVLRRNEGSLFGALATNSMDKIFVDIGFFGCGGIDIKNGITNFHMDEVEVSRKMIFQSQTSIFMADKSKFGTTALNKVANFSEIDIIITDKKLGESDQKEISDQYTVINMV